MKYCSFIFAVAFLLSLPVTLSASELDKLRLECLSNGSSEPFAIMVDFKEGKAGPIEGRAVLNPFLSSVKSDRSDRILKIEDATLGWTQNTTVDELNKESPQFIVEQSFVLNRTNGKYWKTIHFLCFDVSCFSREGFRVDAGNCSVID